jgi:hypothetical protein
VGIAESIAKASHTVTSGDGMAFSFFVVFSNMVSSAFGFTVIKESL